MPPLLKSVTLHPAWLDPRFLFRLIHAPPVIRDLLTTMVKTRGVRYPKEFSSWVQKQIESRKGRKTLFLFTFCGRSLTWMMRIVSILFASSIEALPERAWIFLHTIAACPLSFRAPLLTVATSIIRVNLQHTHIDHLACFLWLLFRFTGHTDYICNILLRTGSSVLIEAVIHRLPRDVAEFTGVDESNMFEIPSRRLAEALAIDVLSSTLCYNCPDLIRLMIHRRAAPREVAKYVLSQLHWSAFPDLAMEMIRCGLGTRALFKYCLKQPHYSSQPVISRFLAEEEAVVSTEPFGVRFETCSGGVVIATVPGYPRPLTVLQRIDTGHTAVVYKVFDEQYYAYCQDFSITYGDLRAAVTFALKVPRWRGEAPAYAVSTDIERAAELQRLALPHAPVVHYGPRHVMKPWIAGIRGDVWYHGWTARGCPVDDAAFVSIVQLYQYLAMRHSLFVKNLKSVNLIWRADIGMWVVVDSGPLRMCCCPYGAWVRYQQEFDNRWDTSAKECHRGRVPRLEDLCAKLNWAHAVGIGLQQHTHL